MTEDVETILAGLEARLRALQSELDEEGAEPIVAPPAPPVAPAAPVNRFSGTVTLEAATDLAGLVALYNGLRRIDGVQRVTLRTYGDGRATLDVEFERFG